MLTLKLLVGAALLTLGRKLYWLFVAGIGFVAGLRFASYAFKNQPESRILFIALALAVIGALLVLLVQHLAIRTAGFVGGGYLAFSLLETLGVHTPRGPVIPFIVGGIVGLVLAALLFDWALILLSSLGGAILISQALRPTRALAPVVLVVALSVGIVFQAGLMYRGWSDS